MRYILTIALAALIYAAIPATPASACEACISSGVSTVKQVACIDSPDCCGEICTSGGGYCNTEGSCGWGRLAADGSLKSTPVEPLATPVRFASSGAESLEPVRRDCDQAIVARRYSPEQAERLRREAVSLMI